MNPTWALNLAHGPIGRIQDNVFSIIIKTSSLINHCLQKWSVFCLLVSNDITFPVSRHKPAGLPNIHHWNYYGLPYSIYYHIHAIIGYCKSIKCLFADTNGHHDTTSVKWNKYFTNYKNILRQLHIEHIEMSVFQWAIFHHQLFRWWLFVLVNKVLRNIFFFPTYQR